MEPQMDSSEALHTLREMMEAMRRQNDERVKEFRRAHEETREKMKEALRI